MDAQALEQAAAQYGDAIFRLALQYTRHPSDAEDMLQEVLLERLLHAPAFDSGEHEKHRLLRVAVNKSKNILRSARRRPLSLEEVAEPFAPPQPSYRELYDAVLSLPRNQRLTLDLYYYEGYSTDEIAGLLGVRPATVRTWLRRAREKLKTLLKEAWDDDES